PGVGWTDGPDEPWPVHRLRAPQASDFRYCVTDWPLLWKEVYHRASELARITFWQVFTPCLLPGLILVGFNFLIGALNEYVDPPFNAEVGSRPDPRRTWTLAKASEFTQTVVNLVLRGCGVGLTVLWCLCTAMRSANSITRERERR